MKHSKILVLFLALALFGAACGSDGSLETTSTATTEAEAVEDSTEADEAVEEAVDSADAVDDSADAAEAEVVDDTADAAEAEVVDDTTAVDAAESGEVYSFQIEVWADNWMGVYVDGVLIGEDSVSITTERSFNSETFSFEASYPFTLAIEAKDYKETDSGLEYIGESNQQMGDGGIIAQVTETSSGEIVAVTTGDWKSLVVHRAPLNTECASDSDPDSTCEFEISETPSDWTSSTFDDSSWTTATVWTAAEVDPKIGYDDIVWAASAELIWGTDLQVDNTVLLRTTVDVAASGSSYGG